MAGVCDGKFKLLALTKTKLKGNGEVPRCVVNGIIASIQAMENVAVLLKNVWHSAVIEFRCINSRTL